MISIIVAMTPNRVIGKNGTMPWHLPEDLRLFKQLTTNNVVIMGRTTFESLPFKKGLPNRHNIVISSKADKYPDNYDVNTGLQFVPSIKDAIDVANTEIFISNELHGTSKDIFIIGGASIYKQTFDLVDRCYLSIIKGEIEGDTYFPDVDWYDWHKVSDTEYEGFTLRIMDRNKK